MTPEQVKEYLRDWANATDQELWREVYGAPTYMYAMNKAVWVRCTTNGMDYGRT